MKHSRIAAAAIALALLAAAAADYATGGIGLVSSAGTLGAPDRSGFKGSDEELQAVTAPGRNGGLSGRVSTTASGNPQGVQTTAGGNPQGVQTTAGGNPDG